jgi:hypothetical protein
MLDYIKLYNKAMRAPKHCIEIDEYIERFPDFEYTEYIHIMLRCEYTYNVKM